MGPRPDTTWAFMGYGAAGTDTEKDPGIEVDLPAGPDDIDIDRVVWDPAYRSMVKELLKGIRDPARRKRQTGNE